MARTTEIVINASPTIALVAALGNLQVLQMYRTVWVPLQVCAEITTGGAVQFAVAEFEAAHWLHKMETSVTLSPALVNTLDDGGRR